MNRRATVCALLAFGAAPLAALAQQPGKMRVIGVLSAPALSPTNVEAIRQGLREHGYTEGRDLRIEWRFAGGKDDLLQKFAAELVAEKVDVIVTVASTAALAAKKATSSIPIIFTLVSDPIAAGLVRSLARPEQNITGLSALQGELTGKRLELLKEVSPSLKSIAILSNPDNPTNAFYLQELRAAAGKLALNASSAEVRNSGELESAFATIARQRAQAVVLVPDPSIYSSQARIMAMATKARLPVLGWQQDLAESGALITYGPNTDAIIRRAGHFVDKILKGAKPGDLPIEQPTTFELIINLKTAKALGIKIPKSVLLRADRVIE